MGRSRSDTSPASTIIDTPITQMTWKMRMWNPSSNSHAQRTSVSSATTSHSPRVARKRASSGRDRCVPARKADAPARKMNTGAQKWVTQRVKKSPGVVVSSVAVGSVG
jgi:hypothetical protein